MLPLLDLLLHILHLANWYKKNISSTFLITVAKSLYLIAIITIRTLAQSLLRENYSMKIKVLIILIALSTNIFSMAMKKEITKKRKVEEDETKFLSFINAVRSGNKENIQMRFKQLAGNIHRENILSEVISLMQAEMQSVGLLDTIKYLIEAGASITTNDLIRAIYTENKGLVKMLIDYDAPIEEKDI